MSHNTVYQQALTYLARREHAQAELRLKLAHKGAEPGAIDAVLVLLEEQGLQSDQRFAEVYARSRSQRGYGPHRIRQELRQKGVAQEWIEPALEPIDWAQQANQVRMKKYGTQSPTNWSEKARQQRFLQQRGFALEGIEWDLD